jgi:hypothetical protein
MNTPALRPTTTTITIAKTTEHINPHSCADLHTQSHHNPDARSQCGPQPTPVRDDAPACRSCRGWWWTRGGWACEPPLGHHWAWARAYTAGTVCFGCTHSAHPMHKRARSPTYIHTSTCTQAHVHKHMYTSTCTQAHAHKHTQASIHTSTCTHAHSHKHMHTSTCPQAHTHMNTSESTPTERGEKARNTAGCSDRWPLSIGDNPAQCQQPHTHSGLRRPRLTCQ